MSPCWPVCCLLVDSVLTEFDRLGSPTPCSMSKGAGIACQARLRLHDRACSAQGINRLGLVFQQLVIASLAVSTVTTLEAAAKWPDLVWLASALFFGVAGARHT